MVDPLADVADEEAEESPVKAMPTKKAERKGEGKEANGGEGGKKRARSKGSAKDSKDAKESEAGKKRTESEAKPKDAKPTGDAKDDAKPKEAEAAAAAPVLPEAEASDRKVERWFRAKGPLNLNMRLKVGQLYSESDLERRCNVANRDGKAKLEMLRSFFTKPDKLLPVDPPREGAKSTSAPASQPASQEAAASRKRQRTSTSGEAAPGASTAPSTPAPPPVSSVRFLTGQICWHIGDKFSRLAKVFGESPDRSYSVRYLKDIDPDRVVGDIPSQKLKPFNIKDLPSHVMNGDFRCDSCVSKEVLAGPAAAVPGKREAASFREGQTVWYHGEKIPSWPAKIQQLPSGEDQQYRIQLYHPRHLIEGDVISAAGSELLPFEKNDMPAFFQVAKIAYEDFMEQVVAAAGPASA